MIEYLISNIEIYGPIAVVAWMFLEEFIPVPSALAPIAAGYILIDMQNPLTALIMVLILIAILGSAASVLSSYLLYSIGFYGGKPALERTSKYTRINWRQVKAFEKYLTSGKEHLWLAGLRAIPLMPLSVISATAGVVRINWKIYGFWSFIGMIPRNLVLGMLGWYLQEGFIDTALLIGKISSLMFIFTSIVLAIVFYRYRNELDYNGTRGLINF